MGDGNVTVLGDWADSYDARVHYSEELLDGWVEESGYSISSMAIASTAKALMTFSQGFVDMGRFGNGVLLEGGWRGVGKDALRGISIVGNAGAIVGRLGRLLQRHVRLASCRELGTVDRTALLRHRGRPREGGRHRHVRD